MTTKLELITPEQAQELLATSTGNPRYGHGKFVQPDRVNMYADIMKAGQWQITPQGIAIDENGVLKDGHHRLSAIIKAGVPVYLNVSRDVPEDTDSYDGGMPRRSGQRLGAKYGLAPFMGSTVASVCIELYKLLNGERRSVASFEEIDAIYKAYKRPIDIAISVCDSGKEHISRRRSCHIAAFTAFMCGVPESILREFFDVVGSGFQKSAYDSCAIIARNRLLWSKAGGRDTTALRRDVNTETAYIQTCLRDFVNSKTRQKGYTNPKAVYTEQWLKQEASHESN